MTIWYDEAGTLTPEAWDLLEEWYRKAEHDMTLIEMAGGLPENEDVEDAE